MANTKYPQLQSFTLYSSGASAADTTLVLTTMKTIDGVQLAMSDFGDKGFLTLEPGAGTSEEQVSFSGLTSNANGTTTLTGVKNVGFLSPYTETSGLSKSHSGGSTVVVAITSGLLNQFANKGNTETVTGTWTFTEATRPILTADVDSLTAAALVTVGQLNRTAVAGAPDGSTTVKGIYQSATVAQQGTATATGSTGARLLVENANLVKTSSGAGDENKIAVLDAAGDFASGFIPNIAIAGGGTGQTTATTAFNALSPLTTKGDIVTHTGTNNVRQGVGANDTILIADSAQTNGVKWGVASLLSNTTITQSTSATTVNNTNLETTLFTVSIPGGTMLTSGTLKVRAFLSAIGQTTSGQLILKIKYGGTTISTFPAFVSGVGSGGVGNIEFNLFAAGATNSQRGHGILSLNDIPTGAAGTTVKDMLQADGTSAVDSTSAQTFLITATWNVADANNTITLQDVSITRS